MGGKNRRVEKPRLTRRNLAFRDMQRQRELSKMGNIYSSKPKDKPIPILAFEGMHQIQPIDLESYRDITHAVNSVISPSRSIEKAVASIMAGMLIKTRNGIYAPGKDSSYSRNERMYTREQLAVFRNSLSVLEVVFGYEDEKSLGVGRFAVKNTVYPKNFSGVFSSDVWKGGGNYNIIYVKDPASAVPSEFEAAEAAEAHVTEKYGPKVQEVEEKIASIGEAELKKAEAEIGGDIGVKVSSEKEVMDVIRKYFADHSDISGVKRQYLEMLIEVADVYDIASMEADEIIANLPGEQGIIERIAQNSSENGIVIVEPSNIDELEGFRTLVSYDDVGVYQREMRKE